MKRIELTEEEVHVLLYCIHYAENNDDEGIRCSTPDAIDRTETIGVLLEKFSLLDKRDYCPCAECEYLRKDWDDK